MCWNKKFYTVYKTSNLINNKYYFGQHMTDDINDNYLGSGVILHQALKKYGRKNFKKEILYVYDNFKEMNDKEIEIITQNMIEDSCCYNIQTGGISAIVTESQKQKISKKLSGRLLSEIHKKHISENQGIYKRTPKHKRMLSERAKNRPCSDKTRSQISLNSASSKYFKIYKNGILIYEGYNLSNHCKKNNWGESLFRRSSKTSTPIKGKTKSTKKFKDWQIIIEGDTL